MNKFKNTIILLVVLLALGGVAWWLMSSQETAVNKQVVFSMNGKDIRGFEIVRTDATGAPMQISATLKEKDTTWRMTAPVEDEISSGTSTEMVNVFAKFQAEETIKDAGDLAEYGLDKPAVTVKANLKKGKPLTLFIGSATAFPDKYYAKFENKPEVYVVDASVKNRFDQEVRFFRQTAVATLDKTKIHQIKIKDKVGTGYAEYEVKNADGKWTLEKPFKESVISDKPDQILTSLPTIFAQDFIDDTRSLAKYGLDQPDYQVDLTQDDGKVITIKASKVKDNIYIMNSLRSPVFKVVGSESIDFMNFDLQYQFDRALVKYKQEEAKSIEYRGADNKASLFTGDDFKNYWSFASTFMASNHYYTGSGDTIPVTVSAFNGLHVKPLARLTYNLKVKKPLILTFYPCAKKDTALVTSSERPYVYEFPQIDAETLVKKADEIVQAKSNTSKK